MTTVPGLVRSRASRDHASRDGSRRAWRIPFAPETLWILGFCLLLTALPFLTVPAT